MSERLTRQIRFSWRERYLKLWSWLRRLQELQKTAAAGESGPPSSQTLWLERLRQHLKRPPRAP